MKIKKLLAFALVLVAGSVQAQSTFFSSEQVVGIGNETWEMFGENTPDLLELEHTVENVATARSTAQLYYGVGKVSAALSTPPGNEPTDLLFADSWTQWYDEVLIDGGELNGTVGTFTASMSISGTASFERTGAYQDGQAEVFAEWHSFIGTSLDGESFMVDGWFGSWTSDFEGNLFYDGPELNQPLTEVTLEFVYGEPFLLSGFLGNYVEAYNPEFLEGSISANLDFSHSAYWNGIGGVFDANGNLVTDYTLISASGTNWSQPVPEPATLAVLTLGAIALLKRRR